MSFQSLLETNEARWLSNDNEETRVYFLANSLRAEECKLPPTVLALLGTYYVVVESSSSGSCRFVDSWNIDLVIRRNRGILFTS